MARMLDTNVLLDILTADQRWLAWSQTQFRAASKEGPILINPIVYSEIAAAFASREELDHWLRPGLFKRVPLPFEAGFRASRAFLAYRLTGGNRSSPLPDFYIGAHAEWSGLTLVTRDVARYRTYFPEVKLVTPGR